MMISYRNIPMYKTFNLENIDFSQLTLIKERSKKYKAQDHSRWVYKDVKNNLYYKMWNPTYIRKDNILKGISNGFYDIETTPALMGTIFYEGICRGYIMKQVKRINNPSDKFYNIIKQKTLSSGCFYFDYCEKHIMSYNNKPCLIDLEGIYPISELKNFLNHKYNSSFADNNYKEFVCSIVK